MTAEPNLRLPVKREPVQPPATIWQQAAPVVFRGAALVAAGVIGEWLLRSATKKAVSMPFSGGKKKSGAVARRDEKREVVAYQETIFLQRTVIRRD